MHRNYRIVATLVAMMSTMAAVHPLAAEEDPVGERLFRENCAACHQESGQGIPNAFPALAGSEVVRGSADDVALVALIGRGDMPTFKGSLDDEELAAIINYVRNAWGNSGSAIAPARVARLRESVQ